jgi:hypothetical protein
VGPVWIVEKARRDTLHRACVFHQLGSAGHVVHSVASGMLNVDALFFLLRWDEYGFYKKRDGTPHAKLVRFVSDGICRSRSALWCVQGTKHQCTIFHAWVGLVRIPKTARRDTLRRTRDVHPVGCAGHIVPSVASGTQNIDALFFMLV